MIRVNEIEIPESQIFSEMQYYPSATQEEAQFKATEALIIEEVLRQRAIELSLISEGDSLDEEVSDILLDKEISYPKATDEACQTYYHSNQERFKSFPFLAVRHILLKAAPDDLEMRETSRTQAELLIKQLTHSPEMFAELAKNYSACTSKDVKGELGQIDKGQTVPEFESQLVRYGEGLIPEPVETRYGFHVVFIQKGRRGTG